MIVYLYTAEKHLVYIQYYPTNSWLFINTLYALTGHFMTIIIIHFCYYYICTRTYFQGAKVNLCTDRMWGLYLAKGTGSPLTSYTSTEPDSHPVEWAGVQVVTTYRMADHFRGIYISRTANLILVLAKSIFLKWRY